MNYQILTKYLTEKINNNINWFEVINKYITSLDNIEKYLNNSADEKDKNNIEKFIKRVKLLGWIDKSDPIESSLRDYYNEYYTKLINKYNYKNKYVCLLCKYRDENNKLCKLYSNNTDIYDYKERVSILDNILTFKGIEHKITTEISEANNYDIIILISQFEYGEEELKQIDKSKFIKPTDTYYNIVYANENDTTLTKEEYIKQTQITYDFIHLIELYMITGNIIINRYHYIIIE